ncbi:hypothetical protein FRUB_01764 [Fimbriiglobus ruber]|uniref:Uncharacterized protein n=1 Tax=Fimbriiglobus ruber TaxID=1908690 RepID=A0A225DWP1_9BACT|nr:hypothetical protein FRUB_01764 [Fimbriiglobus ruber]
MRVPCESYGDTGAGGHAGLGPRRGTRPRGVVGVFSCAVKPDGAKGSPPPASWRAASRRESPDRHLFSGDRSIGPDTFRTRVPVRERYAVRAAVPRRRPNGRDGNPKFLE